METGYIDTENNQELSSILQLILFANGFSWFGEDFSAKVKKTKRFLLICGTDIYHANYVHNAIASKIYTSDEILSM